MDNATHGRIEALRHGKGVPLVLLHGFPFDSTLWQAQLHGLDGGGIEVIAPDLPGFGRSTPLQGAEPTMEAYADALAEWAKSEGLTRIILVGHSMGGYVAFAFARRHAEMLSALVLVCTRPGPDSDAARESRYKLVEEVYARGPQAVVDAMLPKLFAPGIAEREPGIVSATHELMLRQSVEGIVAAIKAMAERPDSTPDLESINAPTLIVTGAEDAIIPAPEAAGMLSRISGARHVAIANAGHLPMLEQPDSFNISLIDFVKSVE